MPDSDSPLELCRRYRDAFFARDVEAILALVTADFVFENVTAGERIEGIDAVRIHIESIHSRWADMRFVERDEGILGGERHAVAEWTALATHPDRRADRVGRDRPDPGAGRPHLPERRVLVGPPGAPAGDMNAAAAG